MFKTIMAKQTMAKVVRMSKIDLIKIIMAK
jgi:hypothetical protein